MFCRRCGNQIPEGLGLCPNCGLETDVVWQPTRSPNQPAAPAPAQSVTPPPPSYATARPAGVGGWLLFFCISFTILWPVWLLSQYARFHFAFRGLGWLAPLRLALGIVVGVLLWTKNRVAMVLLRIYFALSALLALWGLTNWLQTFSRLHMSSLPMSFFYGFVLPVCFLVAGVFYFSKSERVRATYGTNLF